jgi:hypothetical protein
MRYFYTIHSPSAKNNSIQEQLERSRTQLELVRFTRKHKLPALETLREQTETGAIPRHELEVRTAAVEEEEDVARQHVFLQDALHETHEPIDRPSHVDRVPVGQNAS